MTFQESLENRYSCKLFTDKAIPEATLREILQAGRMSPSSHGFEPWKFLVVSGRENNERLSQVCQNQQNVATASHNIIILARSDLTSKDDFARAQVRRISGSSEENFKRVLATYTHKTDAMSERERYHYACLQCYLALMQMVNAATFAGVASCMIGGFDKAGVDEFARLAPPFETAVILALGYKAVEPKYPKQRLALEAVVEFFE